MYLRLQPLFTTRAVRSLSLRSGSWGPRTFCSAASPVLATPGKIVDKLTIIGAGKMAEAIVKPLIDSGRQDASRITLFDNNQERLKELEEDYPDVNTTLNLREAVEDSGLILCCIKPQNTEALFKKLFGLSDVVLPDTMLVSIVAGCTLDSLKEGTGIRKVVRTMPNTPATIGQGMTVWTCNKDVNEEEKEAVRILMQCMGEEVFVEEEGYIDIATAISGSGPAYVLLIMEAMIEAGVHMGYPRAIAKKLVQKTILGTALYAIESNEHPTVLRNDITSPGGTTASALYELEKGRFRSVMTDALWAAYRRSLEMGGNDSRVGPHRNRD